MTCKVVTAFFDKYTGKYHAVGTSYVCSKERFEEVQAAGDFLKEVVTSTEKKPATKTATKTTRKQPKE